MISQRQRDHIKGEQGYALVALLALMSVMALAALAAVPNIRRQEQRERELEAIFRGEEVADAIKDYIVKGTTHQPPTSLDQLIEGVTTPQAVTKKLQILRRSALKDPLSKTGEWRLVIVNSPQLINFQTAVIQYAGHPVEVTKNPTLKSLNLVPPAQIGVIKGLDGSKDAAKSDDDSDDSVTGPFIGVSSRSRRDSLVTYYGLDHHNEWVFTPLFR
jgi:type II secretory pathway pseudopilin PulG